MGRAELSSQEPQSKHLLGGCKIAGDDREASAVEPFQLLGDDAEGVVPGRGLELALPPHIGLVEPLESQAVPDVARLVGNPLLVDGVVLPRQDAQDLAAARIDADIGANSVHDIDGGGLGELPGAGHVGIGF